LFVWSGMDAFYIRPRIMFARYVVLSLHGCHIFDVLPGFGGGRIASISDTPRVFVFYTAYDWAQISRHIALRKCVTLSLIFSSIILFGICFMFFEFSPLSQCTRRKQKTAKGP
jgi:hypothetical protein